MTELCSSNTNKKIHYSYVTYLTTNGMHLWNGWPPDAAYFFLAVCRSETCLCFWTLMFQYNHSSLKQELKEPIWTWAPVGLVYWMWWNHNWLLIIMSCVPKCFVNKSWLLWEVASLYRVCLAACSPEPYLVFALLVYQIAFTCISASDRKLSD